MAPLVGTQVFSASSSDNQDPHFGRVTLTTFEMLGFRVLDVYCYLSSLDEDDDGRYTCIAKSNVELLRGVVNYELGIVRHAMFVCLMGCATRNVRTGKK